MRFPSRIRKISLSFPICSNHITVFLIQFYGVADTIGLLTGDKRTARAAERIEHDAVAHAGIEDWIGHERDRLHSGVIGVLLGLIELPDG